MFQSNSELMNQRVDLFKLDNHKLVRASVRLLEHHMTLLQRRASEKINRVEMQKEY